MTNFSLQNVPAPFEPGVPNFNVTSLKIGSDVTTDKPNGAVIIEDGCTTINAAGVVIIKNDFEVKQGAEFCIE